DAWRTLRPRRRREQSPVMGRRGCHAVRRAGADNLHPAGDYGPGLTPFFFGIALWIFELVAYVSSRRRDTRRRKRCGDFGGYRVGLCRPDDAGGASPTCVDGRPAAS